MFDYDVYTEKLEDLAEGKELNLSLRDLSEGLHKYCYENAVAMVSANPGEYPKKLLVRFGRGQAHPHPYSVKILQVVDPIPQRWQ